MNLTQLEEKFLKAWAHEEINNHDGPAHRLQHAHGVEAADLAAKFRAWAGKEGLDPVSVTRMLETHAAAGGVAWPWHAALEADRPATMATPLRQFTADHRHLVGLVARQAGFADPVTVDADQFYWPLMKHARKKDLLPIYGVMVRDWSPGRRRTNGLALGMRLCEIRGVPFADVNFAFSNPFNHWGFHFLVVDRKDYPKLYRIALRCARGTPSPVQVPVLQKEQIDILWSNTIGYLERANLQRIQAYGGRARRGVLLTGPAGNGKTLACRWIREECRRRDWEWKMVTPDDYRKARSELQAESLFSVCRRGIVFFDDMDLALRDRETVQETEDQAIFLTALDGINVREGVVCVFTTNCPLELIDRAFKRPGRIDVALEFKPPDAGLRRRLVEGWHADIQAHLDREAVVASTDGYSFAEIEELKNLLIMHFMDSGTWDWAKALRQFRMNREDLGRHPGDHMGF